MFKSMFRNVLGNVFFITILVLFVGINCYQIYDKASMRNHIEPGHEYIYHKFKGSMSREKIEEVVERYQTLSEIVADDNYSREGNQPGTYTGYFAGDYGEFSTLFEEYRYRYEYAEYAEKIMAKRMVTNRIQKCFQGRKLENYYDMEGPQEWMEYDFYTLFCVLLTIFVACKMIMYDKKQNIYILLETSSLGMHKVLARKIGALMVFAAMVVVFFFLLNAGLFGMFYDMEGIQEPLYAIEKYKNTLFGGSIMQYCLIQMVGVWISCMVYGIIGMFLAVFAKQELYAMVLGILVYVGCVALFFKVDVWMNPINLLAGTNFIGEMDMYWKNFGAVCSVLWLGSVGLICYGKN